MSVMRSVSALIEYQGKDITKDISKFLKSISYTDVLSGEADDVQVTLEDKEGIWRAEWFPKKGDTLNVTFKTNNWTGYDEGEIEYPVGLCEIDEIEAKMPPSEVTIKSISVPNNTTLRGDDRSRSWEKVELKTVANDIAKEAKLTLFYDCTDNPTLDRVEQSEESDLSFLQKLCRDNGLALKITDKQIVIFDEAKYEKEEATIDIVSQDLAMIDPSVEMSRVNSWRLSTSIRDIYKACRVEYHEKRKKQRLSYTYTDPNKKEGKILVVNEQVSTIAEAERLAKKRLREKNSEETKGSFTLPGSFAYYAGRTINLKGYGEFDGKYIITKATHDLGDAYTTKIDIRRCLNGY